MSKVRDITAIRNSMIAKAKEREDKLRKAAIAEIERLQFMLNGFTQMMGCIIEQTGEMTFDTKTEIGEMHPGRVYIVEEKEGDDVYWTVKLRPDGDKPAEINMVPDKMPEHMLDTEAMERDGVDSVPMVPSCNDEAS